MKRSLLLGLAGLFPPAAVGLLVAGPDDFAPQWSDGRAIAGERLAMPQMTTPPADRRHRRGLC